MHSIAEHSANQRNGRAYLTEIYTNRETKLATLLSPQVVMISVTLFCVTDETACQRAVRDAGGYGALLGAYIPQCDEHGQYRPLQFHPSTGHSWCVDRDGTEILGTRTPPGRLPPMCAGRSSSHLSAIMAVSQKRTIPINTRN